MVFIASMLIVGCGGGGVQSLGIQVGIASPSGPQTVEAGQTVNIIASVSSAKPSTNLDVTWTLSGSGCTGGACGSLTNETSTSVTYTAPASVQSNTTLNVTATSTEDPSKSASLQIKIAAISVTINGKVAELAAGSGAGLETQFSAAVQDDPAGKGVTWALTADGTPCSPTCGTLSLPNAFSATYTPPSTVPASPDDMPTITASSISDPTKSDADQFTIFDGSAACGTGGHESILNGEYAILVQGWSGSGTGTPVMFAASFRADGTGKIISGQDQFNPYSTYAYSGATLIPSASSYSVDADNRGCLTLTDNSHDKTFTFHFSLGGIIGGIASKGDIILTSGDFMSDLRGSGILRQQDPTAFSVNALAANYAFGFSGWDQSSGSLARFGMVGNFEQNGGTLSALAFDETDGESIRSTAGPLPGEFATMSAISSGSGEATTTMNLPLPSGRVTVTVYVINPSELFFVSITLGNEGPEFCGRAIATPSSFDASSLSPNYIFDFTGISQGATSAAVGALNFSGGSSGNFAGTLDQYGAGAANSRSVSGSYALGGPGRLSISDNGGVFTPVCYLTEPADNVSAFCINAGVLDLFGVLDAQPAATYGNDSVSGSFVVGTNGPGDNTVPDIAGVASISAGSVSGTEDTAAPSSLTLGTSFSGSLAISADGTGTLGANTVAVTNGTVLYYIDEANDAPAQVQVFEP
jgi:hypothetical protein